MAATITIYGKNGSSHEVVPEASSVRKMELMKEDYIRLVFTTKHKININLGDYITHETWGTFYITKPQKGVYNKSTGGYDYDIQFDAPHYRWNNKLYKFEPGTKRNEASWSLTDKLEKHMAVFLRNLSHHGWNYTVDPLSYQVDGVDKAVFIQFDNKYMLDALTQIAEAFNVEWWITDTMIHFGKAEHGTAVQFEVGVNVEEMSAEKSSGDYISRLYAFGAARNLPPDYRKNDEQVLLNGVVQKRVMMPELTPYVDIENGLTDDEIVEGIVLFDDVYPRTESAITQVTEIVKPIETNDSTTEATTDEVDENDEEQETATFYRFKKNGFLFSKDYILAGQTLQIQFTSGLLNGMTFDLAFNPDGLPEKTYTHGDQDERVEIDNPDAQVFEIVRNDTYGLFLPNETLKPQAGNTFVLLGWDITKVEDGLSLVTAAENELYQRAQDYAARLKKDPLTYPCTMMADYMYGLTGDGQQDPNYSKVGTFELGQRIQLVSDAYFDGGVRVSRVVGFEYKLDKPYDGAVIYVGESATYSGKKDSQAKLNEAVNSINYRNSEYGSTGAGGSFYVIGTNDTTTPGDSNVYSALRSDRQYARKNKNDVISSLWTFKHGNGLRRGLQTQEYNGVGSNEDNLFGKGFELISKTNAQGDVRTRLEVDELFVRIKAFFAKLEIREISYVGGNYCFSAAGSRIYYVDWIDASGNVIDKTIGSIADVYKFRCYLYSDDGTTATINKWAVDDQVMCRTFNIDSGVHQNVTNKYYWRRVMGIGRGVIPSQVVTPEYSDDEVPTPTEYQYVDISMDDCAVGSDYPEAEDAIVQFGNWTNSARQGVIYLMVEGEGSPAIMEYSGVGANGRHFVLPDPTLMLSPTKNIIYGEFHSVVDSGGSTGDGDSIDDQIQALLDALNDIRNQADKKMEMWFGAYVPLPNSSNPNAAANYPASEWTTDELKALHAQDLFYDTNKAPATQRGRAWRWIAAEGANNTIVYYWDDVTDQDTIDALEKIADVASDGLLTGGAEKVRVFLDWQKAAEEYLKYTEQAHDYGITTELTAYRTAFKELAKMLNDGVELITSDSMTSIPTPAWLQNLQTETVIPSPTTYRTRWADYYTTLAALLKEIQRIAKALADAAQADATSALNKIGDMANDGKLDPTEKLTVKREFIAAYHEMMDTDEAGYQSGILDMAKNGDGQWLITYSVWIEPYINAFRALGTYLNGGMSWTEPALDNFADSALPSWIQSANMATTQNITGDTWRSKWSDFYTKRTAVLTALTDHAQDTADGAHGRINDIVSDGIISAGSEKSLLYIDWMNTVDEYAKYISQATDYFGANYSKSTALTTAYKKLAAMLNGQDPYTNPLVVDAGILDGTTRPSWLNATNINRDTVLSTATINGVAGTADAYRTIWNNYHIALTDLLEAITKKAKELADAAQSDATEALERLDDIVADGKLTLDELPLLRREFEAAYRERCDMTDLATNDTTHKLIDAVLRSYLDNYLASFKTLVAYLQMGGSAWTEPATYSVNNGQAVADADATYNVGARVPLRNIDFPALLNIVAPVIFQADWSNPTTAGDGGAQFRHLWADLKDKQVSLANAMATLAKDNADAAQETADDAQGKIADIVSDGIISGGAEKSQLYIDWLKALHEYGEYTEQAEDYDVSSTTYENAFKMLAAMLNNQNPYASPLTVADAILNGTTRPNWLTATNLLVDTTLSATPTSTADNYRGIWNGYYVALTNLLEAISTKAKELADAAQDTADDAVSRIEAIAADNYLTDTEIPDVRREFLVCLHEIFDEGGLLDQSTVRGVFINTAIQTLCQDIETAIKAIGTFLNNGTSWTYTKVPTTITDESGSYIVYRLNFSTLVLPLYIRTSYEYTTPISINGATFTTLWSDYYTLRTNILGALADAAHHAADEAQDTADEANDRIDDVVSDGILSGGAEKSKVFIDWMRCVQEYLKYTQQSSDYSVSSTNYVTAYTALATMLNGGTAATTNIKNGTDRPAWLTTTNILLDTTLSDYSLTADQYRAKWNDYYVQLTLLIEAIGDKIKSLADDALEELENMADDDVLTEFEKLICLRDWEAARAEHTSLVAQFANDPNASTLDLTDSYYILSNYLNNKSTNNTNAFTGTAPALLVASGDTAIDGDTFKTYWKNYYDARSSLLASVSSSKVSMFVQSSRPNPPYKVGDLWVQTNNDNNIMVCVMAKTASQTGADSDWADLSDITEKRDPRILITALVSIYYSYYGGFVRELTTSQYIKIHLGTRPSTGSRDGEIAYYTGLLYQWDGDDGYWSQISNDSLKTTLARLHEVIGNYTLRVFRTTPYITAQLYDIICTPLTFTDSNLPSTSPYKTVEGGIQIRMYNGSQWEILQEAMRSLIENLPGYVRAVAMKSADDYSTAAGFITSGDWATLFSQAEDADGNLIAQAHLSAFVTKDSNGVIQSGVSIGADQVVFTGKTIDLSADQIAFTGKTVINGKFSVDANGNVTMDGFTATNATITGSITATSGKIGGFKVSGNGLTNENDNGTFTNDAYVILRNDSHRCFVGIGPNVLPSYSTARALARFEIEDNDDWFGGGANIALVLRAKNNTRNFAFMGEGNGVLNGWIGGCKFTKLSLSTANTIFAGAGYAELKTNNTFIVYSSVSNSGISLPRLTEVRSALGINSSTNFCVLLTIIADLASNNFFVRGRCETEDSGGNKPWNTTELPLITHWDGSNWNEVEMAKGDSLTMLLIYDSSKSTTINGFSCYYTARVINKQD